MGDLHHHLHNQEDHIFIPNSHKNSTKRRSPPSSSSLERCPKKHSFDQEDFTRNGFSAITLPFSLHGNVLRRCVSTPEQSAIPPLVKGAGLPPLHPNLRRCLSADAKSVSRAFSSEESTPVDSADSMRLKRMKDRLKEMKEWWDEVMKEEDEEVEEQQQQQPQEEEEEEEEQEEEKEHSPVVEEDKILSQDELGEDVEEAVRVEWAEKCLSLTFKCPCSKGYEVLISANNCYYKLV